MNADTILSGLQTEHEHEASLCLCHRPFRETPSEGVHPRTGFRLQLLGTHYLSAGAAAGINQSQHTNLGACIARRVNRNFRGG